MAVVYKNGRLISTHSDNPNEATEAKNIAHDYQYTFTPAKPTYYEVKLTCSNWLCNHGKIWVRNPAGLTEYEAMDKAFEISPLCPCGRPWKKAEIV